MAEAAGRAGEIDQDAMIAHPGAVEAGRCAAVLFARQTGPGRAAGDFVHRERERRPHRRAEPGLEVHAARNGIGVELDVDVTELGRRVRKRGQRQHLRERTAMRAELIGEYRQHDATVRREGAGEGRVGRGIRRRRGFGENDIETHGARLVAREPRDQLGVPAARPRPASERLQAFLVDGDDRDVVGRDVRRGAQGRVVEQPVPAPQNVGGGEQRGEGGKREPEHRALAGEQRPQRVSPVERESHRPLRAPL